MLIMLFLFMISSEKDSFEEIKNKQYKTIIEHKDLFKVKIL